VAIGFHVRQIRPWFSSFRFLSSAGSWLQGSVADLWQPQPQRTLAVDELRPAGHRVLRQRLAPAYRGIRLPDISPPAILPTSLESLRQQGVGPRCGACTGMLFAVRHAKNDIPSVPQHHTLKRPAHRLCRELGIDLKMNPGGRRQGSVTALFLLPAAKIAPVFARPCWWCGAGLFRTRCATRNSAR